MSAAEVMMIDEAAALLGVHPVTLRRLSGAGRVPCRKVGREWRFNRVALMAWLAGAPCEIAEPAHGTRTIAPPNLRQGESLSGIAAGWVSSAPFANKRRTNGDNSRRQ
jgi:excisionase family DNA binding protein